MTIPGGPWPVASLDPIARARVLGAAIPASAFAEVVLDAPYDTTWAWVSDLPHAVPRFDTQVRRLEVRSRWTEGDAERLVITAWSGPGVPLGFDVWLEDGFCLMRGRHRLYVVVMAARPEGDGTRTRFAHVEAVPLPGARLMRGALKRAVDADMRNLARLAASGF
ncbi:MAG TPA: SRPBCC family protein [Acidimicrobiales bacterium]|nr:SRPBCC family protein [Acidimicrobiales bacterium]